MSAKLRPGRKKITTSFTMHPDVHKEFRQKALTRGDQSWIIEYLVKKFLNGEILVPTKPVI